MLDSCCHQYLFIKPAQATWELSIDPRAALLVPTTARRFRLVRPSRLNRVRSILVVLQASRRRSRQTSHQSWQLHRLLWELYSRPCTF